MFVRRIHDFTHNRVNTLERESESKEGDEGDEEGKKNFCPIDELALLLWFLLHRVMTALENRRPIHTSTVMRSPITTMTHHVQTVIRTPSRAMAVRWRRLLLDYDEEKKRNWTQCTPMEKLNEPQAVCEVIKDDEMIIIHTFFFSPLLLLRLVGRALNTADAMSSFVLQCCALPLPNYWIHSWRGDCVLWFGSGKSLLESFE